MVLCASRGGGWGRCLETLGAASPGLPAHCSCGYCSCQPSGYRCSPLEAPRPQVRHVGRRGKRFQAFGKCFRSIWRCQSFPRHRRSSQGPPATLPASCIPEMLAPQTPVRLLRYRVHLCASYRQTVRPTRRAGVHLCPPGGDSALLRGHVLGRRHDGHRSGGHPGRHGCTLTPSLKDQRPP